MIKKIIFLSVCSVLLVGGGTIWLGYFPIAHVAGGWIWYRDLDRMIVVAETMRGALAEGNIAVPDGDTRKIALERLIGEKIIEQAMNDFSIESIRKEITNSKEQILKGVDQKKLAEAARRMYGMTLDEFEDRVMMPQVREIVLRQHVAASGKEYAAWREEKAKAAPAVIYFLPYRWRDGAVEKK